MRILIIEVEAPAARCRLGDVSVFTDNFSVPALSPEIAEACTFEWRNGC
jgi:hypothetical protein